MVPGAGKDANKGVSTARAFGTGPRLFKEKQNRTVKLISFLSILRISFLYDYFPAYEAVGVTNCK